MANSNSENLAILITDMVGYTERSVSTSRAGFQELMERHNSVLKRTLKLYGGEWVKSTGDGMIALFRSPTNAVQCGMAMQDALAESNFKRPDEEQILIRVSVNLGEVRREGKNDVFGEAVNVAARIEALTPPSEVYFSQAVYLAMNKAEVPSECLGMHTVKGLPEPLEIYRVPSRQATRLVASGEKLESEGVPYLFGGMRHAKPDSKIQQGVSFARRNASAVVAIAVGIAVVVYVQLNRQPAAPVAPAETTVVVQSQPAPGAPAPETKTEPVAEAPLQTEPATSAADLTSSAPVGGEPAAASSTEPAPAVAVAEPVPPPASEPQPQPEAARHALRINAQPADAEIRILNIRPSYTPGMQLAEGRYHVEASRSGYQAHDVWVTLDKDMEVSISLTANEPPPPVAVAPPPGVTIPMPAASAMQTTNPLPEVKRYAIEDALGVARERQVLQGRVQFFFGDTPHGPVARNLGEFRANKKTNAFGKGDVETCQWAFLGALRALEARAIKVGGNAIVNIRSNFGNQQTWNRETFDCKAGAMMSGVALVGVVVKLQ